MPKFPVNITQDIDVSLTDVLMQFNEEASFFHLTKCVAFFEDVTRAGQVDQLDIFQVIAVRNNLENIKMVALVETCNIILSKWNRTVEKKVRMELDNRASF